MSYRYWAQFCFVVFSCVCLFSEAHAQQVDANEIDATGGVLLPSPTITETNDAMSLAINPANLGFMSSWSLTYVGAWVQDQRRLAGQGHGFFFGMPIGPIALGLGVEPLSPPVNIVEWQGLGHRTRFSVGLALNLKRIVGVGIAYRTFWFEDLGDINTVDVGFTIHPANHLALSFVFQDVNSPAFKYKYWHDNGEYWSWSDVHNHRSPRVFKVGLTVRPLGTDRLALGAELKYLNGDSDDQRYSGNESFSRTDIMGFLAGRPISGIHLKLRFLAEGLRDSREKANLFLDGSLGIDLPNIGVGASFAGQLSPTDSQGYQGTSWFASIHGDCAPSLSLPIPIRSAHVVVIEQESRLDSLQFAQRISMLERIARDRNVDMVLFRPDAGTSSLAQAEEMRHQISTLKDAGKKVACYLTTANGPVYLSCAGADYVWVNPAGGLLFAGVSSQYMYFGDLFENLGVKADIVRIGKYKSYPETFSRNEPSDESKEQTNQYLDNIYSEILTMLKRDRRFHTTTAVEKIIDKGPFTAKEALANQLIDEIIPNDLLEKKINELMGKHVFFDTDYEKDELRSPYYMDAPAVAVVHIDGDIVDGESVEIPIINMRTSGAKTLTETLRTIRNDSRIRAVLLRINSPGGSATASDIIWREVMALREEKPVIASLGSIAASGGYYIASAADEVYTDSVTLTGSIGVFAGKADLSKLASSLGVNVTTFKRGEHADAHSWMRPYTDEERAQLQRQMNDFYKLFLDRVVAGRDNGLTTKIVDRVGQGHIWSGGDAKYHLLADQIGGYADALSRAREIAFIPEDMTVFHYGARNRNMMSRALDALTLAFQPDPSPLSQIIKSSGISRFAAPLIPFTAQDAYSPRARLPFVIIDDTYPIF